MLTREALGVILGLALALAFISTVEPGLMGNASAALNLSLTKRIPTVIMLDQLPDSIAAVTTNGDSVIKSVLHAGENVTFTGELMTANGDVLSNQPVKIYALAPTPEEKLLGSSVTGIDGSFSVTWLVQRYSVNTPYSYVGIPEETLKSAGIQTVSILAKFDGNDTFNPSKSGKMTIAVKKWDLISQIAPDKSMYREGDRATVFINFFRGDRFPTGVEYRDFVTPSFIEASFDGKPVELQKKKEGSYTFTTDGLSKEHHQLIVNAWKEGYRSPRVAFLTLIAEGLR